MLNEDLIRKKFKRYISEEKIIKPKPIKKDFFRNKAESSLSLAKELVEKEEHYDWSINISYYSMFYNAISLLAHKKVDLENINESTHIITYYALVYYFHINDNLIEKQYLEDFKSSMEEASIRLARKKSEEILASFRNARDERGEITYQLGKKAELKYAQTAIRRAEAFDRLTHRIMIE